jgi:hypothetical protein
VVGVPDRLEQRVGEAQRQQVLDRLLAQVVVDPEDVLRVKTSSTRSLSSLDDGRSWPNGFSTTTRRQPPDSPLSAIPVRSICLSTSGNAAGGMDR